MKYKRKWECSRNVYVVITILDNSSHFNSPVS